MWHTRLASMDDVKALHDLIAESARSLNAEHYTPEQIDSILAYGYEVDTQLIEDGTYFVVETDDGQIIAAGGWSRHRSLSRVDKGDVAPENDLLNPYVDAARIRAFFVHPSWARRGLGTHLMRTSIQAAWDAGFRGLELIATFTGAPLYEQFGFRTIGLMTTTFPNGVEVSAYRMSMDSVDMMAHLSYAGVHFA